MKSGITSVSASVLCILAAVNAGDSGPRLDLPSGYAASVYARGIEGASALDLHADGTLSLRGESESFEISPPTDDAPPTVMRVAEGLDIPESAADTATLALGSPSFVRMRWDADSGELAYVVTPTPANSRVAIPTRTLALARALARRPHADVTVAPDGALFYADSRAGAVWRIERTAL